MPLRDLLMSSLVASSSNASPEIRLDILVSVVSNERFVLDYLVNADSTEFRDRYS